MPLVYASREEAMHVKAPDLGLTRSLTGFEAEGRPAQFVIDCKLHVTNY